METPTPRHRSFPLRKLYGAVRLPDAQIIAGTNVNSVAGTIVISSDATATLGSDASWSAPGGVIVRGTLGGIGKIDCNVDFASGSTVNAAQGPLMVTGMMTATGTVTVTDIRTAETPVLTYVGTAPSNPEKLFRSDGYLAYAMSVAGYTSIAFATPPAVPANTSEDELLHAFATVKKHYPGVPLAGIANPGVPTVISGADIELADGVATFTYEFGVSSLEVTSTGRVIATATLGGKLTFADGVTLSLVDLNGNPIAEGQSANGNVHTFTFDLPDDPTLIFKVRAAK